jgi:hypothetical protein
MPVLGRNGILRLRREAIEPLSITGSAINSSTKTAQIHEPVLFSGDLVTLQAAAGLTLPLDLPPLPPPEVGPLPPSPIYPSSANLFVYRDQLDRISFYTTRSQALRGDPIDRIAIYPPSQPFTITTAPINNGFITTSDYAKIQANIVDWTLNLSVAQIDTTALGDQFNDAVKSGIVSGGGNFNFLIDRENYGDTYQDSSFLLDLLLLTDTGCKANTEFWMIRNRTSNLCTKQIPGSLYFTADILIVSSAINTSASNIINGSVEFVTVGEIALRMSPT